MSVKIKGSSKSNFRFKIAELRLNLVRRKKVMAGLFQSLQQDRKEGPG